MRYLARGPSSIGLVAISSVGAAKTVKVQELKSVRAAKMMGERCILMIGLEGKSQRQMVRWILIFCLMI